MQLALTSGDRSAEFRAQNQVHVSPWDSVAAQVAEAVRVSMTPIEGPCSGSVPEHWPVIVTIGFSYGGDAAIQFAERVASQGIPVSLGFTVDPVPQFFRFPWDFVVPRTLGPWMNYYQQVSGNPLAIKGHPVAGATNTRLGAEYFPNDPGPGDDTNMHVQLGLGNLLNDLFVYGHFETLLQTVPLTHRTPPPR